jgi:hypothetical protein
MRLRGQQKALPEPAMIRGFLNLDVLSPAAAAAGDPIFDDMTRLIKAQL